MRPLLLADVETVVCPTRGTVGGMEHGEFAYVHVSALTILVRSKKHGDDRCEIVVDRLAPCYTQNCNWQHKPGLVGIRRVLDGWSVWVTGNSVTEWVNWYRGAVSIRPYIWDNDISYDEARWGRMLIEETE